MLDSLPRFLDLCEPASQSKPRTLEDQGQSQPLMGADIRLFNSLSMALGDHFTSPPEFLDFNCFFWGDHFGGREKVRTCCGQPTQEVSEYLILTFQVSWLDLDQNSNRGQQLGAASARGPRLLRRAPGLERGVVRSRPKPGRSGYPTLRATRAAGFAGCLEWGSNQNLSCSVAPIK